MKLKVWGARGSIPAPGPETMRYGGNTSCIELTLSDGSTLILDSGTGIRNLGLAQGASMLVHDCQYTDREYPNHLGWGHSPMSDALEFGHRVAAERLLLFHHDPLHSDADLDDMAAAVAVRWEQLGGSAEQVELATERRELVIAGSRVRV